VQIAEAKAGAGDEARTRDVHLGKASAQSPFLASSLGENCNQVFTVTTGLLPDQTTAFQGCSRLAKPHPEGSSISEKNLGLPTPYYQDSSITIYHGDCRDLLPRLGKFDLVLTDYPYGIGEAYATFKDTADEVQNLIDSSIDLVIAAADCAFVSCGTKNIWRYPKADWMLCWYNPAGGYPGPFGFTCWHPILAYGRDPYLRESKGSRPDAVKRTQPSEKNGHPCPKPLEVWTWFLDRGTTAAGKTVIDPFMGSGTTLRAAKDLRRKAIGIEIEERYCEIAAKRLAQEVLPL